MRRSGDKGGGDLRVSYALYGGLCGSARSVLKREVVEWRGGQTSRAMATRADWAPWTVRPARAVVEYKTRCDGFRGAVRGLRSICQTVGPASSPWDARSWLRSWRTVRTEASMSRYDNAGALHILRANVGVAATFPSTRYASERRC